MPLTTPRLSLRLCGMKSSTFKKCLLIGAVLGGRLLGLAEIPANDQVNVALTTSVNCNDAFEKIREGNLRFQKKLTNAPTPAVDFLKRLAAAQKPHTIILSCSDSRVPPEIIFDQGIGTLFTVRTAGMSLDSNVIGSLEYAIQHLQSRHVVILGHTSCGAVKATLDLLDGHPTNTEASTSLRELLGDLQPRLQGFKGQPRTQQLREESTTNTQGIVQDLLERSALIRREHQAGKLKLTPAIYSLETGKVTFL
jgi:carbonic anhydrase